METNELGDLLQFIKGDGKVPQFNNERINQLVQNSPDNHPCGLPPEVWTKIASYFSDKILLKLSLVSKYYWKLSNQDSLWQELLKQVVAEQPKQEYTSLRSIEARILDVINVVPKTAIDNLWRIPAHPLIFHYKVLPHFVKLSSKWYNANLTGASPPQNSWKIYYYDQCKQIAEQQLEALKNKRYLLEEKRMLHHAVK